MSFSTHSICFHNFNYTHSHVSMYRDGHLSDEEDLFEQNTVAHTTYWKLLSWHTIPTQFLHPCQIPAMFWSKFWLLLQQSYPAMLSKEISHRKEMKEWARPRNPLNITSFSRQVNAQVPSVFDFFITSWPCSHSHPFENYFCLMENCQKEPCPVTNPDASSNPILMHSTFGLNNCNHTIKNVFTCTSSNVGDSVVQRLEYWAGNENTWFHNITQVGKKLLHNTGSDTVSLLNYFMHLLCGWAGRDMFAILNCSGERRKMVFSSSVSNALQFN